MPKYSLPRRRPHRVDSRNVILIKSKIWLARTLHLRQRKISFLWKNNPLSFPNPTISERISPFSQNIFRYFCLLKRIFLTQVNYFSLKEQPFRCSQPHNYGKNIPFRSKYFQIFLIIKKNMYCQISENIVKLLAPNFQVATHPYAYNFFELRSSTGCRVWCELQGPGFVDH